MQGRAATLFHPVEHILMLVRAEIVDNDMKLTARILAVQRLEKAQKVVVFCAVHASAVNGAIMNGQGCEQAGRILVADDNHINQVYKSTLLKKSGHYVVVAGDGKEVIEKLSQDSFDVVVMDIRMPEMGGDETTRIIRNNPPEGVNPNIPIGALTAYALSSEIEHYMEIGFNVFITKPLDVKKLNDVLKEF